MVQASPVGMKREDESLLPSAAFHTANQRVFDLIYMYPETAFMSVARGRVRRWRTVWVCYFIKERVLSRYGRKRTQM